MTEKFLPRILLLSRVSGTAALVLGIALALGYSGPLLHIHMTCGLILVLALWTLAYRGYKLARGLAVLALCWGVLVPAVGLLQVMAGEYRWLMHIVHLLLGVGALAQCERLAGVLRRQG